MKSPIQKRSHIIKEVTLPSLMFQSEPYFGHRDVWVGGRVSEGSGCCIYSFVTILSKPFFYVQWPVRFHFYKVVILYSLLFQNSDPFCNQNFCVLCLAHSLKN